MAEKAAKKRPSFEESLAGLERSLETLRNGDISLEKAMGAYEEGMAHYGDCERMLREAKQRIETLARGGGEA
ncbi:MAG: exodeoxyribonuclease VII small subunit [Clostridiales Family XIII bacterium]|nr:exodeoxyribonuclease VII small subunit [Clostridiales Family XIII bacterium]